MEDVMIKGLYDNVFDLINNKLPYVKSKDYEKELANVNNLLTLANNTFEKYRGVLDKSSVNYFDYYASLAYGCLKMFSFINGMEEDLINSKDRKMYLPLIEKCLETVEIFVKNFENEEVVTGVVGNFLTHISSISEYYRAIVDDKTNDL